jgi:vancomycin permeability regulator SanA
MKNLPQPKDVFRTDSADRADLAIVIGASDSELLKHRINAGVALLKSKKTSRLLLCGDGRDKDAQGRTEAERMKQIAIAAGLPDAALVLDEQSHDLVDMAKNCAKLFKSDDVLKTTKSAFVVSSSWHLLRVFMIMKRHLPHQVSVFCHAATEGHTASNWQTTPQGRATVENELRLIEKLLKTGYSLK